MLNVDGVLLLVLFFHSACLLYDMSDAVVLHSCMKCSEESCTVTDESNVNQTSDKGETAVEVSDPGVIERPRDIAASTSQQHLPRSLRGQSETGSRQSSSLNRDRNTSPDHIPRIHECWSLEPVRRAHRDRRVGELSSDMSSLDSLPASSRSPLGAPSELPVGKL